MQLGDLKHVDVRNGQQHEGVQQAGQQIGSLAHGDIGELLIDIPQLGGEQDGGLDELSFGKGRGGGRVRCRLPQAVPLEQGKQAAAAICGKPAPKAEVPWFWSDQYDVRLQIAGLPVDVRSTVVRGDPQAGRFAVFHLDGEGRLQAVEAVNAAPEFVAVRQWVAAGQVLDAGRIADASLTVKQIVDSASPAAPAPR